tara:strand:- start:1145 stop:1756 length:612 start_codon:yes stop_codon:yes gene_type:complete
MFDKSFYSRVDAILTELRAADVVSIALLGACLGALKICLQEAEVREDCHRQFVDLVLDRVRRAPEMSGAMLADELHALLDETPGLERDDTVADAWPDVRMGVGQSVELGHRRWDVKELDNRMGGQNLASIGRLRNAMGLTSDRPLRIGADLRQRRRFQACLSMQMSDKHDVAINGEQVDRLIRYLGRGDSDSDPRGGRHAILG